MRAILIIAGLLAATTAAAQPALHPTMCRDGLDALSARDYRNASRLLTECMRLELPVSVQAYILRARARAYVGLDYASSAVADQQASIKLERPFDVWPFVTLASYHRSLKQYKEALEVLKQALDFDEDGPGSGPGNVVFYATGLTLQLSGNNRDAIAAFDKSIAKAPNDGHSYFARALSYEALKDRAKAKEDMVKAGELILPQQYVRYHLVKFREYGITAKPVPR